MDLYDISHDIVIKIPGAPRSFHPEHAVRSRLSGSCTTCAGRYERFSHPVPTPATGPIFLPQHTIMEELLKAPDKMNGNALIMPLGKSLTPSQRCVPGELLKRFPSCGYRGIWWHHASAWRYRISEKKYPQVCSVKNVRIIRRIYNSTTGATDDPAAPVG